MWAWAWAWEEQGRPDDWSLRTGHEHDNLSILLHIGKLSPSHS